MLRRPDTGGATGVWAQTTYTVSLKEGTEDADKWTAEPNPATEGQTVTVTYSGTKKVKSVRATSFYHIKKYYRKIVKNVWRNRKNCVVLQPK